MLIKIVNLSSERKVTGNDVYSERKWPGCAFFGFLSPVPSEKYESMGKCSLPVNFIHRFGAVWKIGIPNAFMSQLYYVDHKELGRTFFTVFHRFHRH